MSGRGHMARVGGTRTPAGATPAREHDRPAKQTMPLWPGITWGNDARCSCSWSVLDGVMQVKARNSGCLVHLGAHRGTAA